MLNVHKIISSKFLYILFKLIFTVCMYANMYTYTDIDRFPSPCCHMHVYFRIFLQKLDWSIEIRSIVRTFLFSDVRNMCVTQYNSSVLFLKGYSGP